MLVDGNAIGMPTGTLTQLADENTPVFREVTYPAVQLTAGVHTFKVLTHSNTNKGNAAIDKWELTLTEDDPASRPNTEYTGDITLTDYGTTAVKLEAEDCDLTSWEKASGSSTNVVDHASASGGKYVWASTGDLGKNSNLTFTLANQKAGYVNISGWFSQTSSKNNTFDMSKVYKITIDGNTVLGMPKATLTKLSDASTPDFREVKYPSIYLNPGIHTVKVEVHSNTGIGNPAIDCWGATLTETPTVVDEGSANANLAGYTAPVKVEVESLDTSKWSASSDLPSGLNGCIKQADGSDVKYLWSSTGNLDNAKPVSFTIYLDRAATVNIAVAVCQSTKKLTTQMDTRVYGIFADGEQIGMPTSNYTLTAATGETDFREVTYQPVQLSAGVHTISIKVVENKGYSPCIDYFLITKA